MQPVTNAKPPNYTEEMVEELTAAYQGTPTRATVDEYAEKFGKSPRSVIAKLSTMGIYKTPPRTTKAGKPIVKKEELVSEVCAALQVELPSLVKANKQDLERLVVVINELTPGESISG